VARDAISRQFDVEKNTVKIQGEPGPMSYQPGTITFFAKKGKSIDIERIHESLRATRLSGSTNMSVSSFEITATGEVVLVGDMVLLKVAGTGQEFLLGEGNSSSGPLGRLLSAVKQGGKVTQVTGLVQGWNAKFPVILKEVPGETVKVGDHPPVKRMKLSVTGFQTQK
jgi:hypothetical protein